MSERVTVRTLVQTCEGCPSQWEGVTEDGRVVYIRYRYGRLTAGIGDTLGAAVYAAQDGALFSKQVGDDLDGFMSTGDMAEHLKGVVRFVPAARPEEPGE